MLDEKAKTIDQKVDYLYGCMELYKNIGIIFHIIRTNSVGLAGHWSIQFFAFFFLGRPTNQTQKEHNIPEEWFLAKVSKLLFNI